MQDVILDIEEVVEAAQGLKDVSKAIKDLSGSARSTLTSTLVLSEADVVALKAGLCCLICKGLLEFLYMYYLNNGMAKM